MLQETNTELFSFEGKASIILIPTNCQYRYTREGLQAIMGGGAARQAALRYPESPFVLGERLASRTPNIPCLIHVVSLPDQPPTEIWALPTKFRIEEQSSLGFIMFGIGYMTGVLLQRKSKTTVVSPRLGCGLGGLNWATVGRHLGEVCNDNWTFVTNESS